MRPRVHPLLVLGAAFATLMCGGNDDPPPAEANKSQSTGAPCVADAQCDFPASQCEGSSTLVFFSNPRCQAGRCVADRREQTCSSCFNGGCNFTTTTGALPGFGASGGVGGDGGRGGAAGDPGTDGGGSSGSAGCPPGVLWPCECSDGGASMKRCGPDGAFEACQCAAECSDQDLSRCVAPRSDCADSSRMRYFTDPSCVDGRCAWKENFFFCICLRGACQSTTTAGGTGA